MRWELHGFKYFSSFTIHCGGPWVTTVGRALGIVDFWLIWLIHGPIELRRMENEV